MSDPAKSNLNTILLAACIGLLGWIAVTTHNTSRDIAAVQQTLTHSAGKDADHDRELMELRARITAVEIGLAQLRRPGA